MQNNLDLGLFCEGNKNEKNIVRGMFRVMKEFGYTLDQLKEIPLSTYELIIKFIHEEDKKAQNQAKGRK